MKNNPTKSKDYDIVIGECSYNIRIIHYYPGKPAYINGLPEDSYPEEFPELEWEAATGNENTDYLINNLSEKEIESIEEALLDEILSEHDG